MLGLRNAVGGIVAGPGVDCKELAAELGVKPKTAEAAAERHLEFGLSGDVNDLFGTEALYTKERLYPEDVTKLIHKTTEEWGQPSPSLSVLVDGKPKTKLWIKHTKKSFAQKMLKEKETELRAAMDGVTWGNKKSKHRDHTLPAPSFIIKELGRMKELYFKDEKGEYFACGYCMPTNKNWVSLKKVLREVVLQLSAECPQKHCRCGFWNDGKVAWEGAGHLFECNDVCECDACLEHPLRKLLGQSCREFLWDHIGYIFDFFNRKWFTY